MLFRSQQRQDDKSAWQTVSSFVAWRLTRDAQDTVSSAVDVAAGAARYWRLLADDRAPLPAAASLEATISWRQPSLVFVARDARGLQIAVGRDKAPSRALPLATLMPDYQDGAEYKLPLATVGDVVAQTVATPGLPERLRDASSEDRRRWLLWAVLALAVIGLAVLALRLARDVKAAPPH